MFNELSTSPESPDKYAANEKVIQLIVTLKAGREYNFKKIRLEPLAHDILLAADYSLQDWLGNKSVSFEYKNFLLGSIVRPFIAEEDESIEDAYIASEYYFKDKTNKCDGLAAAYLYERPCISLESSPEWSQNQLPIVVETDGVAAKHQVYNVYSKECFETDIIREFIETLGEPELIETNTAPADKKIHLADHHGKKELAAFWKKLQNSPYVVSAQSTEWGRSSAVLRYIQKDGTFDFILQNTQRRYALKIQTTGRNYRETEAIAKILEEEYA